MRLPLQHGHCDLDQGVVVIDGESLRLTGTERRLLAFLAARPGEVVPYETLLVEVWNAHPHGSLKPIESTLARLRKRIGESGRAPVHLHTEYGEGIRFVPVAATPTSTAAPARAEEASPSAASLPRPLPPVEALARLRTAALRMPLRQVVGHVGGYAPVLDAVASFGEVLTPSILHEVDPLDVAWDGIALRDRFAASWAERTAAQRGLVHAVAAFVPPLEAAWLGRILQRPALDVLRDVQAAFDAGWIYRDGDAVGVDVAAVRWLERQEGHGDACAQHRAFLDGLEDADVSWRWMPDVQLAQRREPTYRGGAQLRGERWFTHFLEGDPAHPADAAVMQSVALLLTNRLDEAVERFQSVAVPEDPHVCLRWSIVGCELASHVGDLVWQGELYDAATPHLSRATHAQAYHMACNHLELCQVRHEDLEEAKEVAFATASRLHSPERLSFLESVYLHYQFQRHPSRAIMERLRAVVGASRHEINSDSLEFMLAAEAEMGEPLSFSAKEAREGLQDLIDYADASANLYLRLALAVLPDRAEAQRLLTHAPKGHHAANRLRRALLQRILHDDVTGLRAHGGDALVERVEALLRGEEAALAGEGWFVLRHALRLA